MTYLVAKAFEVSGLMTLAYALYIGLSGQGMYVELALLAVGAATFYIGRHLEARASAGGRR
ncbi:MAG TPA: hypothetical protein VGK94_10765 [Candidatus Polarisedimenticolia bacterium]|jgi:hypothetical protein